MDILLFILAVGAAVVGIVWAIDIPTSKWMFRYPLPHQKKPLWQILKDNVTPETVTREAKSQAATYTEAVKRMQDREKARVISRTNRSDSSRV